MRIFLQSTVFFFKKGLSKPRKAEKIAVFQTLKKSATCIKKVPKNSLTCKGLSDLASKIGGSWGSRQSGPLLLLLFTYGPLLLLLLLLLLLTDHSIDVPSLFTQESPLLPFVLPPLLFIMLSMLFVLLYNVPAALLLLLLLLLLLFT